MPKRSVSSARAARVVRSAQRTPSRRLISRIFRTRRPQQLRAMRRVGRPPLGERSRQLIAIRLDPDVLDEFRKEARRRRVGYQTLMNEALAEHIRKDVA